MLNCCSQSFTFSRIYNAPSFIVPRCLDPHAAIPRLQPLNHSSSARCGSLNKNSYCCWVFVLQVLQSKSISSARLQWRSWLCSSVEHQILDRLPNSEEYGRCTWLQFRVQCYWQPQSCHVVHHGTILATVPTLFWQNFGQAVKLASNAYYLRSQ